MSRENGFVTTVPRELARSEAMQEARPARFAPIREAAKALSRRGVAAAKCELCNAVMLSFVELCHECDSDYVSPHVDRDGRILIPLPWGKRGYAAWGLRAGEGKALNWLLRRRCERQAEPLFVYVSEARSWYLGAGYESRQASISYLRQLPITLSEFRLAWEAVRSEWSRQKMG